MDDPASPEPPPAGHTAWFAPSALLPEGWRDQVRIEVDPHGFISAVTPGSGPDGAHRLTGPVVPGVPNLHSHAFQRAMAGLAEASVVEGSEDSFWSWRDVMYRFLDRLTPDDVEAVATQLYVEMLEAGYTAVGEFHYLHHHRDGSPFADPAEMSLRVLAAGREAGISLTLLPVLYMTGDFGRVEAGPGQRRFLLDPDDALDLFLRVSGESRGRPDEGVGFAFHSLRAVPPDAMSHCLQALGSDDGAPPIHIHVAEQHREVEACIAWSGARPVEWLLDNAPVDGRWCLVHATHMSTDETAGVARSGAVAGLCPTTEANLGDGLFPLPAFLAAGGRFGVGSDSHVSVSPVEELRWLEYGQRLVGRRRNVAGAVDGGSTGAAVFRRAVAGGARALGRPTGSIEPGTRADLVSLDPDHPQLAGRSGSGVLDSWVFSGNRPVVRDVLVGGVRRVEGGRHRDRDRIRARYLEALVRLA